MKKIILLLATIVLTGCDSFQQPKCWDKKAKDFLLNDTDYTETNNDTNSPDFMKTSNYKAVQIKDIYDDNDGNCVGTVLFSNGKTWTYTYKIRYVKTEKGKETRVYDVTY
ncbi:MAG: hypothetical protein ACLRFF_02735 [Alphaproteobacteria bacterium]